MSYTEEPLAKFARIEGEDPNMDEGQEEWLSEGALTDDEFNVLDEDLLDQNESSNVKKKLNAETADQIISGALKLEKDVISKNDGLIIYRGKIKNETIGEYVNEFLHPDGEIKSEDKATADEPKTSDLEPDDGKNSDDGHSTDELLRMLGGDKSPEPKLTVFKNGSSTKVKEELSSDDIFKDAKIRTVKVAKRMVVKKSLPKSSAKTEPASSDSEFSDDKASLQRIFRPTKPKVQKAAKSTTKNSFPQSKMATRSEKKQESLKAQEVSKKPTDGKEVVKKLGTYKNVVISDETALKMILDKSEKGSDTEDSMGDQHIEYLEDEDVPGDEKIDPPTKEEEKDAPPLDYESGESDLDFYNDIATPDSDELEEWFELDIRAERAADYIPLLGKDAEKLLTEEKNRATLKKTELLDAMFRLGHESKMKAIELEAIRKRLMEINAELNYM